MPDAVQSILVKIFERGVRGDVTAFQNWLQMYAKMQQFPLPVCFSDYANYYTVDILDLDQNQLNSAATLDEDALKRTIEGLIEADIVRQIEPYSEYVLKNAEQLAFAGKKSDYFFAGRDLELQPLQLIRSRVQSFCLYHKIEESKLDEIIISVTEAAENAVKYSDRGPIFCEQNLEKDNFSIRLINSIPEINLDDDINRGKFSEDVSLMRGVLVMSKLLDHLDIERNTKLSRVEFSGRKKIIA